ncbi:hypothetical protein VUR80DRAFT_10008 [Thermomyces stellatus]
MEGKRFGSRPLTTPLTRFGLGNWTWEWCISRSPVTLMGALRALIIGRSTVVALRLRPSLRPLIRPPGSHPFPLQVAQEDNFLHGRRERMQDTKPGIPEQFVRRVIRFHFLNPASGAG